MAMFINQLANKKATQDNDLEIKDLNQLLRGVCLRKSVLTLDDMLNEENILLQHAEQFRSAWPAQLKVHETLRALPISNFFEK